MGKYFMKGVNMMETKLQTDKEKIISKSLKRPSIPRLNLRVIPAFQYSDQLAKNAALIFAYRNEAKRLSSTRSTAVTSRCLYQNGEIVSQIKSPTERAHNTIPAKAVEDTSLRQLSNILDKETRFTAVQEKLNSHLKQVVRAVDSVRPFSYTCQYSSLQHLSPAQQSWDNRPTASPHKVELFRTNLESHKWYEELIETMFVEYRCPSKPELVILARISHILEKGLQFGSNEYIDLLKYLQTKGIDLNDSATSRALILIRYALKVSDEVLLEEFLRKCTVIPAFLSSIDVPKNYSRLSSRLSSASKGQGT